MSDHEHEHEHEQPHFFQLFAGPSKEELERRHLESIAGAHEMRQFILSLDETQLTKLIGLLKLADAVSEAAYYYVGVAANILDIKYGKCMSCGRKHDEELADLVGDGGEENLVKGSKKYDELMYLYGMEQDDDGSDRVMCKNCGKWYENLEDRMLRSPDKSGCQGCVQKEQWG